MTTDSGAAHPSERAPLGQPLKRESLADGAYGRIRRAILEGELEDGAVLKQVDLAREMAVSTVPVREALRRLQAEQLLIASPFQRYVVRSLSPEQVAEYVDVHAALEQLAIRHLLGADEVARRLDAARALAELLDGDIDDERSFELDVAFHKSLHGEDSVIGEMIEDVRHKLRRYEPRDLSPGERTRARGDHQRILDAVAKQNGTEAVAVAAEHALATHRHR